MVYSKIFLSYSLIVLRDNGGGKHKQNTLWHKSQGDCL